MKYIKILIIVFLGITLTGCVSYMELNELGIIDMILIDKVDNQYVVTINMLTATKDDLENKKTYTAINNSIDECLNDLYLYTNKKISFTHLELMAFTPNLHNKEYNDIINLFLNRVDSRNTFSTVIIDNDNDSYSSKLFEYKSSDINNLININHEEYGMVAIKQFDSIIKDILEMKISYIPKISIEDELYIKGYQSIYSDYQDLSFEESLGYNFITNQISQSKLNINNIGLKIDTSNTIIRVNKNEITFNINISYQITNNNDSPLEEIDNLCKDKIKDYISSFINNSHDNYFLYLIEKYQNNYFKENNKINIKYKINIVTNRIDNTNIKGGSYFE